MTKRHKPTRAQSTERALLMLVMFMVGVALAVALSRYLGLL